VDDKTPYKLNPQPKTQSGMMRYSYLRKVGIRIGNKRLAGKELDDVVDSLMHERAKTHPNG
jgi:hypothetical protein